MLGIAIVVGIVAGIYPAIFATSFAPAKALKGAFGLTPQGRKLRTALVCVQLFVSMLMFIYVGILFLQNYHIFNKPYGFDKNQLLYSNLRYIEPTTAEELDEAIQKLTPEEQMLLQLYYFDQRPLKEIAYITGAAENNLEREVSRLSSQLHRIRQKLRMILISMNDEAR